MSVLFPLESLYPYFSPILKPFRMLFKAIQCMGLKFILQIFIERYDDANIRSTALTFSGILLKDSTELCNYYSK
jgi:hypothetical protein